MFSKFILLFIFAAGTASLQTRLAAQIPEFPKAQSPPPAAAAAETPEQTQARLQDWLKESRAALARIEDPSAEAQLPAEIEPAALGDRRRDLDQTVRTLSRTLNLFTELPKLEEALAAARAANQNWNNFPEKPPYSILKLDDLINQRDATAEQLATFKSSAALFTKSFDVIAQETKAVEEMISQNLAAIAKNKSPEAPKWHLEVARARTRLLTVRAFFVRTNVDLLDLQSSISDAELALLNRQISLVRTNVSFTEKDLLTVRKSSDEKRAALRDELTKIRERLKAASAARIRAKAAFDELTAAANPAPNSPELGLAAARLSTAEARVDNLQFISDNLETFESLEALIPSVYENRRALLLANSPAARQAPLDQLKSQLARLNAWEIVSANELAAANADLAKQDSNSSVVPPDDPRAPELAEQRKALWEKQNFIQRILQTVIAQRKNLDRWTREFENQDRPKQWYAKLERFTKTLGNGVKRIWNFEVLKSQNVRDVAGVPITDTHIVTLGVILTAITFFAIAYFVASRFSRRVQRLFVRRGHIAEAQANTLRNWMMIVVGIVLALITLHYLEIPLTVFAFFGGALAIGLGFGTQTLIKNFISGIIVLFERKIRVGDILEVEGSSGKVVEINTRSSVLRSIDGKETLIPNSLFLENRVTNLTLSNRRVRRQIRVGVAYGSPPDQVSEVLKECADRHGLILKDPAPVVTFEDFGESALIFAIYFWTQIDERTDPFVVASDIRIMIEKRFQETGIAFPSPRTELHLVSPE